MDKGKANRMEPAGPNRTPAEIHADLPGFVRAQQTTMAQIMVTAALTTLAEDFAFTSDQLDDFNAKFQKRAMDMTGKNGK